MNNKQITQRFNVVAPKPYYTSRNEKRTQWVLLGSAIQFDDGSLLLSINSLPTGSWWDGNCQLFVKEDKEQLSQAPRQQQVQQAPQPLQQEQVPLYGAAPISSYGDSLEDDMPPF